MKVDIAGIEGLKQLLYSINQTLIEMKEQEKKYWETWRIQKAAELSAKPSVAISEMNKVKLSQGVMVSLNDYALPYRAKRITAIRPVLGYDEPEHFGNQIIMEIQSNDILDSYTKFAFPPIETLKVNWQCKHSVSVLRMMVRTVEDVDMTINVGLQVYYEDF